MLNITWINDNIAVGAAFNATDTAEIKKLGIEAIIDLRSEYCDDKRQIEELGLKFLHIKVDDRYSPSTEQLKKIFEFVLPFLKKNKKVLMHCQNGYGRSPLVAIALLTKQGMDLVAALGKVKQRHPACSFTPQQEKFLYSFQELLQK